MIKTLLVSLFLFIFYSFEAQSDEINKERIQKSSVLTAERTDTSKILSSYNEKLKKTLTIGLEYRPRFEFRYGYKQLLTDTSKAAYFGTQRCRISINYTQNMFSFHTSVQDLRVWGQYAQSSSSGSLNVFEAYVDAYLTKNMLIRLGRQKVELDNGRLFSAANWSQAGRAHDGFNFIITHQKWQSELISVFNQPAENNLGTNFSPSSFSNYKTLQIHYLKLKLPWHLTFMTINSADGYQSKNSPNTLYVRGNSGGRLDFEKGKIALTISAYYQYGQLQSGQKISAHYVQPEIQYKFWKLSSRIGMEYLSGDNATKKNKLSNSFVPLYGVAWKFMGNMDYFTSFPSDTQNGGLINPYLFFIYSLNKKIAIKTDQHLFYLQNNILDAQGTRIPKYLGFESDLSIKYILNDFTTIDYGFSFLSATKSMETIKGGNHSTIPIWSYLMITFDPELFKHTR